MDLVILISCFADTGFEIPDKFVVGYALDYNEYFRDLGVRIYSLINYFLMTSTCRLCIHGNCMNCLEISV